MRLRRVGFGAGLPAAGSFLLLLQKKTLAKEITIFVKSVSGNVSSRLGDDLYIALDEMDGAENIDIRTQDGKLVEMTMTYKSEKPVSAELAKALRKVNPTLSSAERLQAGNTITLCIGGTQCK